MANAEQEHSSSMMAEEAAVELVRQRVLGLTGLFVAKGVSADIVRQVAEEAAERERRLCKEVNTQNPLMFLEQALDVAAGTDAERYLAERGKMQIGYFRDDYAGAIRREVSWVRGTDFSIDRVMSSINDTYSGSTIYVEKRGGEFHPSVTFMPIGTERNAPPSIALTPEMQTAYAEKVLHGLGALNEGQSLRSLVETVPYRRAGQEASGAFQHYVGKSGIEISQLPTRMSGVDMRVVLRSQAAPTLTMSMDMGAFNRTGIVLPSF